MNLLAEPIPVRVTRYRCPFCATTRSSKASVVRHMVRCWRNPAARSCKTCLHYEPFAPGDWAIGDPGESEGCGEGMDLTDGLKVGCPGWASKNDEGESR